METIESFLNAPGDRPPRKGEAGVFSDWLFFHRLNVKGNALQFVEKRVLGLRGEGERECIEIPVAPGAYTVECRGARFGDDVRIAAMRAFPEGAALERGKRLGDIPVDFGGVSVVDIEVLEAAMQENVEEYEAWLEDILFESDIDALIYVHERPGSNIRIPSVESGFGDGTYDVFALLSDGKPAGLEIVFIEENETYPI